MGSGEGSILHAPQLPMPQKHGQAHRARTDLTAKSPRRKAGALPLLPRLFRERFTGQGIEQLPEGRTEDQLRTTGDEGDEEIFIADFFGHIVDTDTTTDFFTLDKEGQQGGLNEIDMTGQLRWS